MSVTIRDIASRARVSVSTVSRVLNDRPDVRAETERRIRDAIEELGYSPNTVARGLVLQRAHVVGFIVPDITNPSFPELARGIVGRAKEHGYSVMFFDTNHDSEVEKQAIGLMRSKQVDGIIVSFDQANTDELDRLKAERVPVVQIYRKSSVSAISTIAIDNVGSGRLATRHLLDLGHTRIGLITTGISVQSGRERLDGYRSALRAADLPVDDRLIQISDNSAEGGASAMRRLLDLDDPPSAVFACHDVMAIGAYGAVYDAGLAIPQDVSFVGHDNLEMSRLVRPRLTTIDTHKDRLGAAGVDLLMKQIEAGGPLSEEVVFPTELIVRESATTVRSFAETVSKRNSTP